MFLPDSLGHYSLSGTLLNAVTGKDNFIRITDQQGVELFRPYYLRPQTLLYSDFWNSLFSTPFTDGKEIVTANSTAAGNIQHLPFLIGRLIGKGLHLNVFLTILLSAWLNILMVAYGTYWAIRKTPILKSTFVLVVVVPMSLSICASVHYDAFVIVANVLYFSQLFFVMYTPKHEVRRTDWFRLILFCGMMGASKNSALLLITILLIPIKQWGSIKRKILGICGGGLAALGGVGLGISFSSLTSLLHGSLSLDRNGHSFQSPISFVNLVEKTDERGTKYTESGFPKCVWKTAFMFYDRYFGDLDNCFFDFVAAVYSPYLQKRDDAYPISAYNNNDWNRSIFGSVLWVGYQWSRDSVYLIGIQGQYYLPLLIPIFYAMLSNKIHIKKNLDRPLIAGAMIFNTICLYESMLTIFMPL